jgi:hypothetical protein
MQSSFKLVEASLSSTKFVLRPSLRVTAGVMPVNVLDRLTFSNVGILAIASAWGSWRRLFTTIKECSRARASPLKPLGVASEAT